MQTILITVGIFALMMTMMAVGVIIKGKCLSGSCGGTGANCTCKNTEVVQDSETNDGN